MRIILFLITLPITFFLFSPLCLCSNISENDSVEIENNNLLHSIQEAITENTNGNSKKAINILNNAILNYSNNDGISINYILKAKLNLGFIYTENGEYKNSKLIFEEIIPQYISLYGEHNRLVVEVRFLLANTLIALEEYNNAIPMLHDTLKGYAEFYPISEQASILFTVSFASTSAKQLAKAAFFMKMCAGIDSYYKHAPDNEAYEQPLDIAEMAQGMKDRYVPLDVRKIYKLLKQPNSADDTPYNKARSLMSERETPLYERYAEVAHALGQAAACGSLQEKEAARDAFEQWLAQADAALGKK